MPEPAWQVEGGFSLNRIRTKLATQALAAEFTQIELVDPAHDFSQVFGKLSDQARFEVFLIVRLLRDALMRRNGDREF